MIISLYTNKLDFYHLTNNNDLKKRNWTFVTLESAFIIIS